jgi:ribose/galactose isomerase
MRIGVAADHAGFVLKEQLTKGLVESGHQVVDFGVSRLTPEDDYPDYVVALRFDRSRPGRGFNDGERQLHRLGKVFVPET